LNMTRRAILATAGAAAVPGAATAAALMVRILTDRLSFSHAGAIVLAPGRMIDAGLIARLPAGAYRAVLSPANAFLLAEYLRDQGQKLSPAGDFTMG